MKPSGEFFRNLGVYVYGYKDPETVDGWNYIGKGVGDRAYAHVEDKGLDWDDCFVIARNMENYGDGHAIAHALESFCIEHFKPKLNLVKGKYQEEIYIMSRFAGLFEQHLSEQREMFREVHDFISENEIIRSKVGYSNSRNKTWTVETGAIDNIYCSIKVDASGSEDKITVTFKGNRAKAAVIEAMQEQCSDLETVGTGSGNDPWFSVLVYSLDDALQLWTDFVGG